jgi:hypothetical protein
MISSISYRATRPAQHDKWFHQGWWIIPGASIGLAIWASLIWIGVALAL